MILRSPKIFALGILVSFASFVGVLFMPAITPFEFFYCTPSAGGGTECFGNPNQAYPLAILLGVIGIGLFFFGWLGGKFVFTPFFIISMFVLGYGLFGLILGYIGFESCISGKFTAFSCLAYGSEFNEPPILLGVILIGINGLFWKSRYRGLLSDRIFLPRLVGASLGLIGAILVFFSYLVIYTRYSNYAGPLGPYWVELVTGIVLICFGVGLVCWSQSPASKIPKFQ